MKYIRCVSTYITFHKFIFKGQKEEFTSYFRLHNSIYIISSHPHLCTFNYNAPYRRYSCHK